MRITKEQLRQIIKEELEAVMNEQSFKPVFLKGAQQSEQQVMADALEDLQMAGADEGRDYKVEDGGIYIMDKSYADSVLGNLSNKRAMSGSDSYDFDVREV